MTANDTPFRSSRYSVAKLLTLGLVFHLVYIVSVFDCYFTSPVVNGMQRYNVEHAESKRLVLIVGNYCTCTKRENILIHVAGDGLRADLLLNVNGFYFVPDAPAIGAPHLRSIIESRGAFGVSHTRVPTESRPGHVAIIGMYHFLSRIQSSRSVIPQFQVVCMKTYLL